MPDEGVISSLLKAYFNNTSLMKGTGKLCRKISEEELQIADKYKQKMDEVRIEFLNNIDDDIPLEKNIKDNIDIVIDKLTVSMEERSRIFEDIEASCKMANGKVVIIVNNEEIVMSEKYACVKCNYSIRCCRKHKLIF